MHHPDRHFPSLYQLPPPTPSQRQVPHGHTHRNTWEIRSHLSCTAFTTSPPTHESYCTPTPLEPGAVRWACPNPTHNPKPTLCIMTMYLKFPDCMIVVHNVGFRFYWWVRIYTFTTSFPTHKSYCTPTPLEPLAIRWACSNPTHNPKPTLCIMTMYLKLSNCMIGVHNVGFRFSWWVRIYTFTKSPPTHKSYCTPIPLEPLAGEIAKRWACSNPTHNPKPTLCIMTMYLKLPDCVIVVHNGSSRFYWWVRIYTFTTSPPTHKSYCTHTPLESLAREIAKRWACSNPTHNLKPTLCIMTMYLKLPNCIIVVHNVGFKFFSGGLRIYTFSTSPPTQKSYCTPTPRASRGKVGMLKSNT